jgi:hypothetical protein
VAAEQRALGTRELIVGQHAALAKFFELLQFVGKAHG